MACDDFKQQKLKSQIQALRLIARDPNIAARARRKSNILAPSVSNVLQSLLPCGLITRPAGFLEQDERFRVLPSGAQPAKASSRQLRSPKAGLHDFDTLRHCRSICRACAEQELTFQASPCRPYRRAPKVAMAMEEIEWKAGQGHRVLVCDSIPVHGLKEHRCALKGAHSSDKRNLPWALLQHGHVSLSHRKEHRLTSLCPNQHFSAALRPCAEIRLAP
jgi:hypothetical protein